MSKGSNRRPRQVSREQWAKNYELVFGKKKKKKESKKRIKAT